jgi:hypothetical protein
VGAGSGSREPERLLNQSCTESGEPAYCIGHIACHVGSADCDAVAREGKSCSVRGWVAQWLYCTSYSHRVDALRLLCSSAVHRLACGCAIISISSWLLNLFCFHRVPALGFALLRFGAETGVQSFYHPSSRLIINWMISSLSRRLSSYLSFCDSL